MGDTASAHRHRDERGAVAVMMALMLPLVLLAGAFIVDLGLQRVARADAQALADVVALDLARELDGREISPAYQADMEAAAADSLARNTSVIGGTDHVPQLEVRLGELDDAGVFSLLTSGIPTAVQVVADTGVDFAFAGVTGQDSGTASRSAIGVSSSSACFQLGSWAASWDPEVDPPNTRTFFEGLLEQILGSSTVGLAGWDGLATSTLRLGDLLAADSIAVGTVDGLLSMPSLTAGDLFLAMAEVLNRDGATAQANVLDQAAASAVGDVVIDAGELLGLTTATEAALEARFNALDLLVGTAFLANGDNFFDLPNLQAGVPSVGVTEADFSLIERPRRACNQDTARTAQAELDATAKLSLNIPLLKNSIVNLKLVDSAGSPSGDVMLDIDLNVAGAHGQLTDFECDPATFEADVLNDLLTLRLSGSTYVQGKVTVEVPVLGVPTVVDVPVQFELDIQSDASRAASATPEHIGPVSYPPQAWDDSVEAGGSSLALPPVSVSLVSGSLVVEPVAGIPLTVAELEPYVESQLQISMGLINDEFDVVNPLIAKLNAILGPLSAGIGLSTAGADFFGLPTPTCQQPALRG